jgi:peroxin-19
MLDEFSPAQPAAKTASQLSQSSGPGGPQPAPEEYIPNEGISADDDFTKHLQAGMADLLGQLENSPEIQAQFESMLKGFGGDEILEEAASRLPKLASSSNPTASKSIPSKPSAAATAAAEKKFQETIKKTMERMQSSGDQATAAAVSENTDDIIAEMMKAMQASGLDGEGGEEDFSKMLLGMMEQLTNKEILYEPMKELDDKFPEWMKKNQGKVKEDDMKRYKEQQVYVREIMQRFERKGYSDDNVVDREYIVERMQKVKLKGSLSGFWLILNRCKQLARLPQILWATWQQPKRHLAPLKKDARNNKPPLLSEYFQALCNRNLI